MLIHEAVAILAAGQILENCDLQGALTLRSLCAGDDVRVPIHIRNAMIGSIEAPACQFHRPVVLEHVRVAGKTEFFAGYFFGGFRAAKSQFAGAVDFQCGGHNRGRNVFSLELCDFSGFVNFYDCWYEGPVVVRDCRFSGGSNLRGNIGAPYQVRFDVLPVIERNEGQLDVDQG